ncbi:MAG: sigma-70 family RNA polymerase sigma factor [Pirellulales bacterium]|nr:sigma-70 family RNA polymerase sigma factor [Pirellulales bacterium]
MCSRSDASPVPLLWEAYWNQGKSQAQRNPIVEHYFPLVSGIVKETLRRLPRSIDRHAIESAAGEGLMEAVERFEVGRRCGFPAYAGRVMRSRIRDALRRIAGDRLRRSSRDVEQLCAEESLVPDLDDVPWQATVGSPAPGTAGRLPLLAVVDGHAYQPLDLRAKAILHLRFSARFRQREIAQVLGITQPRVSQILREVPIALPAEWLPPLAALDGHAYRALDLKAKAILHLCFSAKFRQREIAQLLGITRPRVSQLLREAIIALHSERAGTYIYVQTNRRRGN